MLGLGLESGPLVTGVRIVMFLDNGCWSSNTVQTEEMMHDVVMKPGLLEIYMVFLCHVLNECSAGVSWGSYIMVFLQQLRGQGSSFIILRFVLDYPCIASSEVDLAW